MEEACRLLEDVVNVEMRKRKQFDLEWGGNRRWIANVAAANCYEGAKENVGFHSDGLWVSLLASPTRVRIDKVRETQNVSWALPDYRKLKLRSVPDLQAA